VIIIVAYHYYYYSLLVVVVVPVWSGTTIIDGSNRPNRERDKEEKK